MSHEAESVLCEIEYLTAKKYVAKKEGLSNNDFISLLIHLKNGYTDLASHYLKQSKPIFVCQTLVSTANTIFELFDVSPEQIEKDELHSIINRLFEAIENCCDLNISRSAFVAIGKLYFCLGDYIHAEEYILKAFEDFDYSIPTFQLLIKILDKQEKYLELLSKMEAYLHMGSGYHNGCSFENFDAPNILQSPYKSAYRYLFDNDIEE